MGNPPLCQKILVTGCLLLSVVTSFGQDSTEHDIRNYIQRIPVYFPLHKNDLLRVSSVYGYRKHPIHNKTMLHQGIDLVAQKGKPVYATAAGTVETADFEKSYGNRVIIAHLKGVKTLYGHLWVKAVKPGQTVSKGQLIGFVGDTGRVTGPHLHYEVWIENRKVDPMLVWKKFIKEPKNIIKV